MGKQEQISYAEWMPKFFFASIFICLIFIPRVLDNDIYFLLNDGQYIMQHGIPHIEPFTLHDNMHFVMQQWLSSVVFLQLYQHFGVIGILSCVYVMAVLMLIAYYRLCMLVSGKNWYISSILSTIVGGLTCSTFMVSRPQIFSTFFLLVALYCLESYHRKKKMRYLATLPFFSILLINFHAAIWGMLLCVIIAYLVALFFSYHRQKKEIGVLGVAFIAVFLCGFINPYGSESMSYVLHSYGIPLINQLVGEMHPLDSTTILGKVYLVWIAFCWFIYVRHSISKRYVILCLGLTYMSFSAERSLFLFLFLGTFPLAACFSDCHFTRQAGDKSGKKRMFRLALVIGIVVLGVYDVYQWKNSAYIPARSLVVEHPTVDYLLTQSSAENIRLWNTYNEGSYAEFKGIKANIDTRAEVFLPANNWQENYLMEYCAVAMGAIHYEEVFQKYHINYVLTSNNEVLYEYLLHDDRYELLFEENHPLESHRLYKRIAIDE